MAPADVTIANMVRDSVNRIEPGADPSQAGQMLVENLQNSIDDPGAQAHRETYEKILAAAKELAAGDKSKVQEIKTLAETLPKGGAAPAAP
jgi:hypothetical protein